MKISLYLWIKITITIVSLLEITNGNSTNKTIEESLSHFDENINNISRKLNDDIRYNEGVIADFINDYKFFSGLQSLEDYVSEEFSKRDNSIDEKIQNLTNELKKSNDANEEMKTNNNKTVEAMKALFNEEFSKMDKSNDAKLQHLTNEFNKTIEEMRAQFHGRLDQKDIAVNKINANIQQLKDDNGCTLVDGRCFSVHLDFRKTWSEAKKFCISNGGNMPSFPGNKFNLENIPEAFPQLKGRWAIELWVDCTDETVEDKWIWGTGQILPLDDGRWYSGEPDNQGGDQHFMELYYYTKDGNIIGEFNDADHVYKSNIICEFSF